MNNQNKKNKKNMYNYIKEIDLKRKTNVNKRSIQDEYI